MWNYKIVNIGSDYVGGLGGKKVNQRALKQYNGVCEVPDTHWACMRTTTQALSFCGRTYMGWED